MTRARKDLLRLAVIGDDVLPFSRSAIRCYSGSGFSFLLSWFSNMRIIFILKYENRMKDSFLLISFFVLHLYFVPLKLIFMLSRILKIVTQFMLKCSKLRSGRAEKGFFSSFINTIQLNERI